MRSAKTKSVSKTFSPDTDTAELHVYLMKALETRHSTTPVENLPVVLIKHKYVVTITHIIEP
jgi:hypothetical protein